jgi:hypothetical protein
VDWCFPLPEDESILKHSDTLQDEGQSPQKDRFRETFVVCFILVTWSVQYQVVRRSPGPEHKEPTAAWLKYCTSICLIRLEKSMKTLVNDLTEIWARHVLNTCVVFPLHQLIGQQWKNVMSYTFGTKWLGSMQHIAHYK